MPVQQQQTVHSQFTDNAPYPKVSDKKHDLQAKYESYKQRIIKDLHQRGYHENHPDYHRLLGKCTKLAIQKVNEQQTNARQQQQTIQFHPTNDEYNYCPNGHAVRVIRKDQRKQLCMRCRGEMATQFCAQCGQYSLCFMCHLMSVDDAIDDGTYVYV